jgi:polyphosphate kinase 2 (PPK2 family)
VTHKDSTSLRDRLRLPLGEPVDLTRYDAAGTPDGPEDKAAGKTATARTGERLAVLQERLWAASTKGDRRRVLLVLQGMDTSGKGGTVKHVIGLLNPSGCRITAFKAPTAEEQRRRLLKRLDKPEKRWKFAASDIDDRALWPAFQEAYEIALERCGTSYAPWYLIPADHKWYRNWAVSTLLLEDFEELDPRYPKADFDVAECRKRLLERP